MKNVYELILTYPNESDETCGVFDSFEKALAALEYMKSTKRFREKIYGGRFWQISADKAWHSIVRSPRKDVDTSSLYLHIATLELNQLDAMYVED